MKFLVLLAFYSVLCEISHAPIFKIKESVKGRIRENGLIHFTSLEHFDDIYDNGLRGEKSKGFLESFWGKIVWTYEFKGMDDIENKHKKMLKKNKAKNNPEKYGICIKITGISEEDLNRLHIRYGFLMDHAIGYHGENLKADKIELIKKW